MSKFTFGVIGTGAWGSAFACALLRAGIEVTMWDRDAEIVSEIARTQGISRYFNGLKFPAKVSATTNISDIYKCDVIVIAIPIQAISSFFSDLKSKGYSGKHYLLLSKGIDISSSKLVDELFEAIDPSAQIFALSGPNFAHEIAKGLPAAADIAGRDAEMVRVLCQQISSDTFRAYTSDDLKGVQVLGAVKNVIAIASGICEGLQLGENARSTLIARSLNEISTLVNWFGGRQNTIMGLAGIGDLMLTCNSKSSRNFTFGYNLAKGAEQAENVTVEGYFTTKAVYNIATANGLDLPICTEVYRIAYEGKFPKDSLVTLMRRAVK